MTVNEIRKRVGTLPPGETRETIEFLLREVDLARASAIGYGATTILEGICDPDECLDIIGWRDEAVAAGIINLPDIPNEDDDG